MPFYVIFVQLPQRFQTVNFTTAERAGILLLPCTLVSPLGAMIAGLATKKVAVEYVLITAAAVVCIGTGLLGALPTYSHVWPGTYGYEIIVGLGLGLSSPPGYMLLSTSIAEKDISVGTGALNMMRTLGGCVAVAICTAVHREYTSDRLAVYLSPEQIAAVQTSGTALAHMPEALKNDVAQVFGRSYNRQFLIMLAFTGLNLLVTILLAIVRKRMGVFGTMVVRKEENEFFKVTEKAGVDEEAHTSKDNEEKVDTQASSLTNGKEEISVVPAKSEKL